MNVRCRVFLWFDLKSKEQWIKFEVLDKGVPPDRDNNKGMPPDRYNNKGMPPKGMPPDRYNNKGVPLWEGGVIAPENVH